MRGGSSTTRWAAASATSRAPARSCTRSDTGMPSSYPARMIAGPQPLPDLPRRYVLVVHSDPDESEELLAYAREVCREEDVHDPIVAPDVYPATLVAPNATRIFTGGGFNAMRQFGRDPRHRPF